MEKMKIINKIYCDMDGVLADFNNEDNALGRFEKEKGFFINLKPLKKNVKTLNKLIKEYHELIYILSASPNLQADNDKMEWLKKYVPGLKKENIIIIRNGQCKANFGNGVLFDDYGKNITEWINKNPENAGFKVRKDGDLETFVEILKNGF